jgi:endonuclease YncB( thermonuclease family)
MPGRINARTVALAYGALAVGYVALAGVLLAQVPPGPPAPRVAAFAGASAPAPDDFNPGRYPVTVLDVHDGDTITVAPVVPVHLRLLGADAPELHDNAHGRATPAGAAARDFLAATLRGRRVFVAERWRRGRPAETLGRRLADVYVEGDDGTLRPVAGLMIAAGHAVATDDRGRPLAPPEARP